MVRVLSFLIAFTALQPVQAFEFIYDSLAIEGADLRLGLNDGRWKGERTHDLDGRAMVHGWLEDELLINFDQDFEGGVKVLGDFFIQDGWWGGHQLRVVLNNPGIEIGSSTGRLNFWHTNHGYTDIYARNITAADGGSMYGRDFIVESDVRLKENIRPIRSALETVLQLRGVEYNFISDEDKIDHLGFIAQEVEKVVPQLVYPLPDTDKKGVDYQGVIPILVEAMQEQQKLIAQQAEQIKALEAAVKALQ
ncbi:tail fiber domain-containing protein [Candidatus Albibeggiatoa sp. nov. NOAA]|uniref:tail fiber domain-containing protein n=1 Tax=Candidatus Albibeggiatoa sp. nov. NOAA TaxID=3162724 RepID=UPI0032F9634A|nr:tail fiber domain-containing protein [Thiotrichaceae bacterium]